MKIRTFAIITLLMSTLCGIDARAKDKETVVVTPIENDADAANGGIIYALPKTMLRVRVEAELTICKTGPYYKYSNKFLNLSNVITEDSKKWSITNVTIDSYGAADYSRRFKISGDALPDVMLTPDGILAAINAKTKIEDCGVAADTDDKIEPITFDDVHLGRSVLTKTSTAAMAEEAALTIYRLRDKRFSLLGGEDATILNDMGSYEKVIDEINKLEAEYISLFAGKTEKHKVVRYYEIDPSASAMTNHVLFRFSENEGFMSAMDITGKPVYIDYEFNKDANVNEFADGSKMRKQNPVSGLRYIIPGSIAVKIIDRNILLSEKVLPCTQCGQVATLPLSTLSNSRIKFDTTNGSLKSIEAKTIDSKDQKKK